jgi:hypothetical protein
MKIDVPKDHAIGMKVPVGGSSCAKCKYVSEDGKRCSNSYFKKWNEGEKIPAPADSYCCDMYEIRSGRRTLSEQLREQRTRR